MTNVLVGGKKREDVLARHLEKIKNSQSEREDTSAPVVPPPYIIMDNLMIENQSPGTPTHKIVGSFTQSIQRLRSSLFQHHLLPVHAIRIAHETLQGSGHQETYAQLFNGQMEWMDVVLQESTAPNGSLELVIHEHPEGITERKGPRSVIGYSFENMTSKKTYHLPLQKPLFVNDPKGHLYPMHHLQEACSGLVTYLYKEEYHRLRTEFVANGGLRVEGKSPYKILTLGSPSNRFQFTAGNGLNLAASRGMSYIETHNSPTTIR